MSQVYRSKFFLTFGVLFALFMMSFVIGLSLISYLKYDATLIDMYNKISMNNIDFLTILLKFFLYPAGGALAICFSSETAVNENGIVSRNIFLKKYFSSWDKIYEIKPVNVPLLRFYLIKSTGNKWPQWAPDTISQDILVLKKIESINS